MSPVLVSVVMFLMWTGCEATLTSYPVDLAVITGHQVRLNCTTDTAENVIMWQYNAMTATPIRIVYDCEVNPDFATVIAVDKTNPGQCDLIILSATMKSAGTYTCQSLFDQAAAVLVMLGSNSTCSYTPTDPVYGEFIHILCILNYNGTIIPKMGWYVADTGYPVNNATTSVYPNQVNSYIDVPVYAPASRPFTCVTYFDPPIEFRFVWTLPTILVLYSVTNIRADVNVRYFDTTTLTCKADGYPTPTFQWTNLETGQVYYVPTIGVGVSGTYMYKCTAQNSVRDQLVVLETQVEVELNPRVPEYCPTTTTTTTTTTTPEPTTQDLTTTVTTTTTTQPIEECGKMLWVAPPGAITFPPDWKPLCYITKNDTELLQTPCKNLIMDLPPGYADYNQLLASGGNFGCLLSTNTDFSGASQACFDNYQHDVKLGQCGSCQQLFLCIKLPAAVKAAAAATP